MSPACSKLSHWRKTCLSRADVLLEESANPAAMLHHDVPSSTGLEFVARFVGKPLHTFPIAL
jgi:hypothetical protein